MNWEISYGYEGGPHNGPTNPHSVKDHLEAGWEPFAVTIDRFDTTVFWFKRPIPEPPHQGEESR